MQPAVILPSTIPPSADLMGAIPCDEYFSENYLSAMPRLFSISERVPLVAGIYDGSI